MLVTFLSTLKFTFYAFLLLLSLGVYNPSDYMKSNPLFKRTQIYEPKWDSLDSRPIPEWYDEAKIGILIHWSPSPYWGYTQNDQKSFLQNHHPKVVTTEINTFKPNALAKFFEKVGVKYVVIGVKYYDGLCFYPSTYSKTFNTFTLSPNRDFVKIWSETIRQRKMKLGLYYSLFDLNGNGSKNFVRRKLMPELYEVVTKYKPDLIWGDGEWMYSDEFWESKSFLSWLYSLSPVWDIVVVNDRWGNGTRGKHGGFYTTQSDRHKFEYTLNVPDGILLPQPLQDIIFKIANIVSFGGNVLLKVDLTQYGTLPRNTNTTLTQIGKWLSRNSEAIYKSKPWIYPDRRFSLSYTSRPDLGFVYVIFKWPEDNFLQLELDKVLFVIGTEVYLLEESGVVRLMWEEKETGIVVYLPNKGLRQWCWTLRIISLCDEYSLPLDHVKRRPNSAASAPPETNNWTNESPVKSDKIQVIEAYCEPKDSTTLNQPTAPKYPTSYIQPYPPDDDSEGPQSEEDDEFCTPLRKSNKESIPLDLNSPDSIAEAILPLVNLQSPDRPENPLLKRHPSPYYYSDLYRKIDTESPQKVRGFQQRKSDSLALKRYSVTEDGIFKEVSDGELDVKNVGDWEDLEEDEMTRQRHLYETAFDCKVAKSDDDLDEIDRISNHPVLVQLNTNKVVQVSRASSMAGCSYDPPKKKTVFRQNRPKSSIINITDELSEMKIQDPLRGFTPSPPSTAPLPTKFAGKDLIMNSIRSAPNLPTNRIKDLRLPIKSLRGKETANKVLEIKSRPHKDKKLILEFKGRPKHKYSSTESVETSSSGGSMESIRSSTSEGNRSTSSSESRHSTSLSSHSSDSGSLLGGYHLPPSFLNNKLHILSPISDKSSQEPVSETSDNNRNNNSQKCSPEEKINKRKVPNKNILNLAFKDTEIQGSDSGISIQSRGDSRNGFGLVENKFNQNDLNDLPFDMPKLRRRRMVQDACTSGSATSVELRDLPFDMPKLRRRLKTAPITDSGMSLASSSQSVQDGERQTELFRPKLTLNFGNSTNNRTTMELNIGLNLNIQTHNDNNLDLVDIDLPLERQGWYHGAITRVEAESVLKLLREGSFLVRNSESTRQDYSLSLKSARGFMHMRIQRADDSGQYILGQFSKPFDSIPEMIRHFTLNRLPVRGAEHMCLSKPVVAQLL